MSTKISDYLRRYVVSVVGVLLIAVGTLLLVLPGPGLLVLLAGLVILTSEFPSLKRFVSPVRRRAMQAAEDSVSTPIRIAGSVSGGFALIAAGVVWGIERSLPLSGWGTGVSLIASGLISFILVGWSYRRVRARSGQVRTERP